MSAWIEGVHLGEGADPTTDPETGEQIEGQPYWYAGCDVCHDYVSPGPRTTKAEAEVDAEGHTAHLPESERPY